MEQTANTVTGIKKNPSGFFRKNVFKIIIVLLIVTVGAELFFGGMSLFSPGKTVNTPTGEIDSQADPLTKASLDLVADKASYVKGEAMVIDVKLSTGGHTTDSTDIVVKYDPAFLEPDSKNFAATGGLYSEYPAVQVEKENGLIGISGITSPDSNGFKGEGSFAKLSFKAIKSGQTRVAIDFVPGQTADSNVVLSDSTVDILGSVKNADIIISE